MRRAMLSTTLCAWLVIQFFLICFGSFTVLSWVVEHVETLQRVGGFYTRGLPTLVLGFASLVMHLHPGYRLEVPKR